MTEFRQIKLTFLLMGVLQITALNGQRFRSVRVKVGNKVILPCENMIEEQHDCDSTTWLFSYSRHAVPLFEKGRIHKDTKEKSDRLSVTDKCALVIKNVTAEDAGLYFCRQFKSGRQHGPDFQVNLSVNTNRWRAAVVSVGAATLLMIAGAIMGWRRSKANRTKMDDNKAGPEDGVIYTSIRFTKRSEGKAWIRGGDDAVTYSAVKASSCSAVASADPCSPTAAIN